MRVAVNGLGRMGKLLLRRLFDTGLGDRVALVNEPDADAETAAFLLEFDSVHGRWRQPVAAQDGDLEVDGHRIRLQQVDRLEELDLAGCGIDLAVDCSGRFKSAARLAPYFDRGVETVLVSAPVKETAALNIVYGVNHELYDPARHHLLTAASCTTNCLAPVVKVVHERFGIVHGSITTIHDVTNTQTLVDRPHKDLRRARSALTSLIPTTTGSATAIGLIYPELAGRLNGHAVRVPQLNASLTDCVFELARDTTEAEVNAAFNEAAEGPLRGILGFEARPLVSADYLDDPRSAIVDGPCTMVVNRRQLKVYAWYDNEWGYVCRMADILAMVAAARDTSP
ncbi:ArsJ-associated glyceraldehyde-3-phosphate dehydrogenase [Marinibaculum pumilum]|uniref:Glyceraldehyde-3-phosphate dehydrogenase n=1 Tax=Marinibaculum pumilum TaxID=1766165 RepID=A0ABV7L8V6_9PROT